MTGHYFQVMDRLCSAIIKVFKMASGPITPKVMTPKEVSDILLKKGLYSPNGKKENLRKNVSKCFTHACKHMFEKKGHGRYVLKDYVANEIENINNRILLEYNKDIKTLATETEGNMLVKKRIGQDKLRKELLLFYKSCIITGISDERLLRASHIIPWSKCSTNEERLGIDNCLLLSGLWDLAFDSGLISFDSEGKLKISSTLSLEGKELLKSEYRKTIKYISEKQRSNMNYHLTNIFIE